jgi:hypothetical protein
LLSTRADAARTALGVLVRSAHLLPPPLAEQLVQRMGQCRMTESARNLAGAVAAARAPGSLADPAVRQAWPAGAGRPVGLGLCVWGGGDALYYALLSPSRMRAVAS